jgi:hypothetical protein
MEPDTHDDLWDNYLYYRPGLHTIFDGNFGKDLVPERLVYDYRYATQMARMHYWRVPDALPEFWDLDGMWFYYRYRYNTVLGKSTFKKFKSQWVKYDPVSRVRDSLPGQQVA